MNIINGFIGTMNSGKHVIYMFRRTNKADTIMTMEKTMVETMIRRNLIEIFPFLPCRPMSPLIEYL